MRTPCSNFLARRRAFAEPLDSPWIRARPSSSLCAVPSFSLRARSVFGAAVYDAHSLSRSSLRAPLKLVFSRAGQDSDEGLELLRSRVGLFAASFTLLSITASLVCPALGVALLERTWSEQAKHAGNLIGLAAPVSLAPDLGGLQVLGEGTVAVDLERRTADGR
jgi:hypothetical protein